jgi:hypothetical protein
MIPMASPVGDSPRGGENFSEAWRIFTTIRPCSFRAVVDLEPEWTGIIRSLERVGQPQE